MTFKVGDKVVRINHDRFDVKVGQVVEVSGVWADGIISIVGDNTFTYDSSQFVLAKPVPPTCQDQVRKPVVTFEIGQWVTRRGREFQEVKVGGRYRVLGYRRAGLLLANLLGDCLSGSYDPQYFELDSSDVQPVDQHAPGAKLDAGKQRPELVLLGFANALASVVRVGTDGANKYTDNGWQEVPNGFNRYREAKARHDSKFQRGQTHDEESHSLHLTHVAWNALASLELYLKQNPEHKEPI